MSQIIVPQPTWRRPFLSLCNGLVGYWPLHEGGGNTVTDLSGNGNNGTLSTGQSWESTAKGYAVSGGLDTADAITVPHSLELVGMPGLTLAIWAKNNKSSISTTGIEQMVGKAGSGDDSYALYWEQNENVTFATYDIGNDDVYATATDALTDDEWHFWTATYDGALMRLYKDGVFLNSAAQTGSIYSGTHDLTIGGDGFDDSWDGFIQHAAIWNRALNTSEIKSLYADPHQMFRAIRDANATTKRLLVHANWEPAPTGQEDFTDGYTEVDQASDITITADKVDWSSCNNGTTSRVYKDMGANYFDRDFEHRFKTQIHSSGSTTWGVNFVYALGNRPTEDVHDWQGDDDGGSGTEDFIAVKQRKASTYYGYYFYVYEGGSKTGRSVYVEVSANTTYFISIVRDWDGGANGVGQYAFYVCTGNYYGESGSSTVGSGTVDASKLKYFRYVFPFVSYGSSNPAYMTDGYTEDLQLFPDEEEPPSGNPHWYYDMIRRAG